MDYSSSSAAAMAVEAIFKGFSVISNQIRIITPVLFIGGLAMKGDELKDLAHRLGPSLTSPFMAFDNINVGSGPRGDLSPGALSLFDQADHQWNLVHRHLGASKQKISIFGISMGGMIAATMAYLKPDLVDRLILAATSVNLPDRPAVPQELYEKWTQVKTEKDIWDGIAMAFGKTTLEKFPEIPKKYFDYRIAGANGQKAREFLSQIHSIRSFDGEKVYSALSDSNIKISVLAGEEDILFDSNHISAMKSKLPKASFKTLEKTGHMLHLENPELLAKNIFEALTEL